jgi:hypothetical protein
MEGGGASSSTHEYAFIGGAMELPLGLADGASSSSAERTIRRTDKKRERPTGDRLDHRPTNKRERREGGRK